jgi:hypothetical protein
MHSQAASYSKRACPYPAFIRYHTLRALIVPIWGILTRVEHEAEPL